MAKAQAAAISEKNGILASLTSCFIWGILPLYWNLLSPVGADEILTNRICWSLFFMLLILAVMKRWGSFLQDCRDLWQEKKRSLLLLAAASIISINWLTYIWAVNHNHVLDTSLGYYINPLMSVLLGVVIFNEKLSKLKCISIALAFTGILLMTWQLGTLPWVAVVLATTFSAYGALKKQLNLNPLSSITLETLLMIPIALPYLGYLTATSASHLTPQLILYLAGTGIITAFPLILFTYGANSLPLNVLGFIQYISPTITLFLGIFFFHESFGLVQLITFSFIWAAIALFTYAESRHI